MSHVKKIIAAQNQLGEGPLWHAEEQALYWVDIRQMRVHRWQRDTSQVRVYHFDTAVTALGIRSKGGFVTSTKDGFAFWDGVTEHLDFIDNPIAQYAHHRFNDGAVAPDGHFWAGTMYDGPPVDNPDEGFLFRLDDTSGVYQMERGLTISNGLGWSPDQKSMYLTDTQRKRIYSYDFDLTTSTITNRRDFLYEPDESAYPDGLTVDSEGCLWIAWWGGWKVTRYDPDGKLERVIELPVACPTSCTFGGPELDELYITSAWDILTDADKIKQPEAGDIFQLRPGVKGLHENTYQG